jgi:hypothetical protein
MDKLVSGREIIGGVRKKEQRKGNKSKNGFSKGEPNRNNGCRGGGDWFGRRVFFT